MRRFLMISMLIALVPALLFSANPRSATREGLNLYENEEYDKALAEFLAAMESAPDRKELPYDVGTTLYKLGNYPEALKVFAQALDGENPDIAADAWYNLGNAQVKNGNLKEALTSYKNALRVRHDDMDAKHNLESVLRMMQMQPPQQQQSQQSDSTSNDDEQQQQKQQQQQQQQSQPESDQEQKQTSSPEQMTQAEEDSSGQSSQQPTEMTPEEALQLLQALETDEQEAQKEKLKREFGQPKKVEKDW